MRANKPPARFSSWQALKGDDVSVKLRALIAGVDEAGRGPLAGPVVAAAVILDPLRPIEGLTDSKKLSSKRRAFLERQIIANALCWSVARVEAAEIDRINILQATLLAMRKAVMALAQQPTRVLVDGNHCPDLKVPVEAIVKGDLTEATISAASILAKESRDRIMRELDEQYPEYGLCEHMGYPTKRHIMALGLHGPCQEHRRSFAPVRRLISTK